MNDQPLKAPRDRTVSTLSAAAKAGLYSSEFSRNGVEIDIEEDKFRLSQDELADILVKLSDTDIEGLVTTLKDERVPSLDLEASSLLKLRASLLLGLGGARFIASAGRRAALARTYWIYTPPGQPLPTGVDRFHDGKKNIPRAEREALLRQIVDYIRSSIVSQEISSGTASVTVSSGERGRDDYEITDYEDQHTYPEAGHAQMSVDRRRTIKALRDGVDSFRAPYEVVTKTGATAKPRLIGLGSIRVENVVEKHFLDHVAYSYQLRISFPALAKGVSRELHWVVESEWSEDDFGPDSEESDIKIVPQFVIGRAKIGIRFPANREPSTIWAFEGILPADVQDISFASERKELIGQYVEGRWENLREGRATGLSWRW